MNSLPPVDGHSRLRAFVTAPLRRQTYRNLLYLGLAFPLGLAYFVLLVVGVTLGVGLSFVLIGIPILAGVVMSAVLLADFERWLATRLLGLAFDTRGTLDGESPKAMLRTAVTDRGTWTALCYVPVKVVIGFAGLLIVVTVLTTAISLLLVPLYFGDSGVAVGVIVGNDSGWSVGLAIDHPVELHPALAVGWNKLLVGFETIVTLDHWQVRTLPDALAVSAVGALLGLVGLNVVNGLARLAGWVTQWLLDDGYSLVRILGSDAE